MAIPDFQTLMRPLLQVVADGREHSIRDARERLANQFSLSQEEKSELLPSGRQPIFDNRVAWAKSYLQQAGIFKPTRRAHFEITERGQQGLSENPPRIDIGYLERFPEFVEFRYGQKTNAPEPLIASLGEQVQATPEEALEAAYERIRNELATELLKRVKESAPEFLSVSLWSCSSTWAMAVHDVMREKRSVAAGMKASMESSMKTGSAWI